jgi:hypothetical protein
MQCTALLTAMLAGLLCIVTVCSKFGQHVKPRAWGSIFPTGFQVLLNLPHGTRFRFSVGLLQNNFDHSYVFACKFLFVFVRLSCPVAY